MGVPCSSPWCQMVLQTLLAARHSFAPVASDGHYFQAAVNHHPRLIAACCHGKGKSKQCSCCLRQVRSGERQHPPSKGPSPDTSRATSRGLGLGNPFSQGGDSPLAVAVGLLPCLPPSLWALTDPSFLQAGGGRSL